MALDDSSRGMREHCIDLGDLHANMADAPIALLGILDAYVHLYSAYIQPPPQMRLDMAAHGGTHHQHHHSAGAPIGASHTHSSSSGTLGAAAALAAAGGGGTAAGCAHCGGGIASAGGMAQPRLCAPHSAAGDSCSEGATAIGLSMGLQSPALLAASAARAVPLSSIGSSSVGGRGLSGALACGSAAGGTLSRANSMQLSLPDLGPAPAPPSVPSVHGAAAPYGAAPASGTTPAEQTPLVGPTAPPSDAVASSNAQSLEASVAASPTTKGPPAGASALTGSSMLLLPEAALGAFQGGGTFQPQPLPPPQSSALILTEANEDEDDDEADDEAAEGAVPGPEDEAMGERSGRGGGGRRGGAVGKSGEEEGEESAMGELVDGTNGSSASAAPVLSGVRPPPDGYAPEAAAEEEDGEVVAWREVGGKTSVTASPAKAAIDAAVESTAAVDDAAVGNGPGGGGGQVASGDGGGEGASGRGEGASGEGVSGEGVNGGGEGASGGGEASNAANGTTSDGAPPTPSSASYWTSWTTWWRSAPKLPADATEGGAAAAEAAPAAEQAANGAGDGGDGGDGGHADGGKERIGAGDTASGGGSSSRATTPQMGVGGMSSLIPPHLVRPLPLWAHSGTLDPARHSTLGGPPPPVLDEVRRLYRSSIRRCWAELCRQAALTKGGRAAAAADLLMESSLANGRGDVQFGMDAAVSAVAVAGGGGGAVGPVLLLLSVEQLLELAQAMGVKLDLEARRFHPVFAQYAPSIAEYAAEEWGGLFVAEQLVPSLRAHCEAACADGATESKVAALGPFLPLWRQMHRMNARKEEVAKQLAIFT